jgi:hypothetical protein
MTVLTMPVEPGQDAAPEPRPVPWRTMLWVTWRQHRATLISVPAVLGALAVFLLIAGLHVHHDAAAIAGCSLDVGDESKACIQQVSHFNSVDWTMGNTVLTFMNLLPALLGAFTGAPVLARELENGTFRYAWTQGQRRDRQAIAKLALLGVTIAVLAGAFGELFAWFFDPFLRVEEMNVLAATAFITRGIAFAAWTLVAFAIGAFLGMLLRRILPAMAATLGAYLALALVAWDLRKHYPVALITSNPNIGNVNANLTNAPWVLSTWFTGPGGKPANQSTVNQVLALAHGSGTVTAAGGAGKAKETLAQALAQHGITEWTKYIPVSHFWPMQLFEAGWLLALSAVLIAATVWLVRRRVA